MRVCALVCLLALTSCVPQVERDQAGAREAMERCAVDCDQMAMVVERIEVKHTASGSGFVCVCGSP